MKKIISLPSSNLVIKGDIVSYIKENIGAILNNKDLNVTLKKFATGFYQQTVLLTLHNFNDQQVVLKKSVKLSKFSSQQLKECLALLKQKGLQIADITSDEIKYNDDKFLLWKYIEPTRISNLADLDQMILKFWQGTSQVSINSDQNLPKFTILDELRNYGNVFADPKILNYFPDQECVATYRKWIDYFLRPEFKQKYEQLPKFYAHRDLTPGNIIVKNQDAFLIDWDYANIDTRLADIIRPFGFFGIREQLNPNTGKKTYHSDPTNLLAKINYFQSEIEKSPFKMTQIEKELFPQIALLSVILDACEDLKYHIQGKTALGFVRSKVLTLWGSMKIFIKANNLNV